jgi:cell division control protein 45
VSLSFRYRSRFKRRKGRQLIEDVLFRSSSRSFSLTQCHQAYANMDISLKRQLPSRMDSIAPEYGLVELSYSSFTRTYGFRSLPLSAADAVEAINSLLQAAVGVRLEVEIEGGKGGGEWFGGSRIWSLGGIGWSGGKDEGGGPGDGREGEEEDEETAERRAKDEKAWEKCFWASFDALKAGGEYVCGL